MANLSITSYCNRRCSYCFANGTMREASAADGAMGLETFERALAFLERSGIRELRLLGGEPTLHPKFGLLIDRAVARSMRVCVFTGGLVPRRALDHLVRIPATQLTVLLNVLHPQAARPAEQRRQSHVIERLAERVVLGLNIDSPAVDPGFLLDWIDRHALQRVVRLGIAHPDAQGGNRHLSLRHFAAVGALAARFARQARAREVAIDWDCGWVPCMFPESAQDLLHAQLDQIGKRCNPILDIMPDGRVIPCYPLGSVLDEDLSSGHDAASLRQAFTQRMRPFAAAGLFRHCSDCRWRATGQCTGGCRATALQRLSRCGQAPRHPAVELEAVPPREVCA